MLHRFMRVFASFLDAIYVLSLILSPIPKEHFRIASRMRKVLMEAYFFFAFPIMLLSAFLKETDEREGIFVFYTLPQALSYSEWRHLDTIWENVKDNLPPSLWNKSETSQKQKILLFLLFLGGLDLAGSRLENKEEFIKRRFLPGIKPSESMEKMAAAVYDTIKEEDSYYGAVNRGVQHVFLRKPMGTKSKSKRGLLWSAVPAAAQPKAAP